MIDDDFEARILSFERAWQRNGPSAIADVLDRPPALSPSARTRVLRELISIDLELRARDPRSPGPSTLESYAAQFPELGPPDEWPLALIEEEYRVRCRWGDRPTHGAFLGRFRARHDLILAELARIDAEQLHEAPVPRRSPARAAIAPLAADPSPALPPIAHQDVLLQRMIGAGRMGKVYQAWQHSAERAVAVKFLRKTLLEEPRAVARFLGEARTVAKLAHPNIVAVHGMGRTPGGACFLVMDLVTGPNLADLAGAGPIAVADAVRWTIALCDALEHAHARGVIHCDLKPANILRDGQGLIRVTDFGLARSLFEDSPWTAEVEGTAPFMAPEQACRSWGEIDRRTDVYGIGAVLYTLLTGRPPWTGRRLPEILAHVISGTPALPAASFRPDLPRALSDLCDKCLAKSPAARFPTVQDVRSAMIQ